jgi:hypothetical protein
MGRAHFALGALSMDTEHGGRVASNGPPISNT